ncbi:hypothetical protein B9Z19DRAFT_1122577 [Tuber borchii]|uniref:Uncharacterized protein n=1 Tax=Tuber borchii TaxID=42251 RepID=A0A2T7A027_TUBBO|nr:hypothetical protein B9Z19DRAFT_1122577 [Tuber borchii]
MKREPMSMWLGNKLLSHPSQNGWLKEAVPLADNGVVAINIDESNIRHPPPSGEPQASESAETSLSAVGNGKAKEGQKVDPPQVITIEELDKLRSAICGSLIDRSLDVLWVNSTVTFELSSLLTGAFGKVSESSDVRKEVASTILQSVMPLQADDLWPCAKTIMSTFPLLGFVLQNQDFFDTCLEDINDQILALIDFIEFNKGEPTPWIASILLVMTRALSELPQLKQVPFTSPPSDQWLENIAELNSYQISDADYQKLDLNPAKETEAPAKEIEDKEVVDKPKPVGEVKAPGLESPDEIIHLLLCELLAKDALDNYLPPNALKEDIASVPMDVQMEQGESTGKSTKGSQAMVFSKPERPEFKAEQNSKFIYRFPEFHPSLSLSLGALILRFYSFKMCLLSGFNLKNLPAFRGGLAHFHCIFNVISLCLSIVSGYVNSRLTRGRGCTRWR